MYLSSIPKLLAALKVAFENPIENVRANPMRDASTIDLDLVDRRTIPVPVVNRMPASDI
jgi:hypothetical protein